MMLKKRKLNSNGQPISAFATLSRRQNAGSAERRSLSPESVEQEARHTTAENAPFGSDNGDVAPITDGGSDVDTEKRRAHWADTVNSELLVDLRQRRLDRLRASLRNKKRPQKLQTEGLYSVRKGEELFAVGQFELEVIEGAVTISGAVISTDGRFNPVGIVIPPTHAIPSVSSVTDVSVVRLLSRPQDQNKTSILETFSRLSPQIVQTSTTSQLHVGGAKSSYQTIWTDENEGAEPDYNPLFRPLDLESWHSTISRLCHWSGTSQTIQICGAPGRGKKTLAQQFVNSFLTQSIDQSPEHAPHVKVLDLDFASPFLSPPGQISLYAVYEPIFGPSYCHTSAFTRKYSTLQSHSVTLDGYQHDPRYFRSAVSSLISHASELQTVDKVNSVICPLLVICPFWMSGEVDILMSITRLIKPARVVCLSAWKQSATADGATLSYELEPIRERAMVALEEAVPRPDIQLIRTIAHPWVLDPTPYHRSPAQVQEMALISYFHHYADKNGETCWNSRPLITQRPFQLSYGVSRRDFCCLYIRNTLPKMHKNMISSLIIGKIVSIVILDEEDERLEEMKVFRGEGDKLPYLDSAAAESTITSALDPARSHTIGLGLIRAVDLEQEAIQMYTPVSLDTIPQGGLLNAVLVLDTSLPTGWAYEEHLHYNSKVDKDEMVAAGANVPYVTEVQIRDS